MTLDLQGASMPIPELCLLDQLETAALLEIDGLYSWQFSLDEGLLDEADAAAAADLPFASDGILLRIELMDGRQLRRWQFSYNQVMEAQHDAVTDSWSLCAGAETHRLTCQADIAGSADHQG
jgi:hypothetical protein